MMGDVVAGDASSRGGKMDGILEHYLLVNVRLPPPPPLPPRPSAGWHSMMTRQRDSGQKEVVPLAVAAVVEHAEHEHPAHVRNNSESSLQNEQISFIILIEFGINPR